jgi:short-subunit dehydrogenase
MGELTDRAVLLTGASQGIGHALALQLAAQGARLGLVARDAPRLEEVVRECAGRGARAVALPGDVGAPADCRRVVEQAQQALGGLDVLINNAGIGMMARFDELQDLSVYERLMRVNYLGCVWLTHAALPALKQSRGRIVVVASLAGLTGVPTRTGYAASKHAVIGFFDSLRIELMGSGVSVTVACPDFVVSQIHKRAIGPDGRPLGATPMQEARIMSAEDCAAGILRATERRERQLIMSARGRVGRYVRLLWPGLIDRIAIRAVREGR